MFIRMVDENVGYAASDGGMVFKTSDGGENWVSHGITGTVITGMSFPRGSDTGYICSYSTSKMHQITPVGLNVINFDNAPFWWQAISAPSHETIWLSSGTSVYTYDPGGLTDQPVTSDNYFSLDFIRQDLGWGCGSHGVEKTVDGTIMGCIGKNIPWVVLTYTQSPLYDCFSLDEDYLWAVGGKGQIYFTDNASDFGFDQQTSTGWTNVAFQAQPNPCPDATLRSVFFTSVNHGFAAGNKNTLLKYMQVSGVDETNDRDLGIYPNPTHGKFQITDPKPQTNSKNQIQNIEVVDLYGKVVADIFCDLECDISGCPAGVYFVRIGMDNNLIVKKIIKL